MSNQMQVYQQTRDLLKSEDVKGRFREILGENSQAFLASVLSAVYQNNDLQQCDPQSVLAAAMKAAILNLPIEPSLGQAYIIPYKGKATFQIGYKGIIQLAHRTNEYQIINVTQVFEGEQIKEDRLTGQIILNGNKKSDKVIGYCGYFKLKNGFQHYLYMTNEELEAHGKRYSPSYNYDSSLWKKDPVNMKKKTILKLLLGKYGPLTINLKTALAEDIEPDDDDVVEGRILGEEEPDLEPPQPPPAPKKKEQKVEVKDTPIPEPEPPPPFEEPEPPKNIPESEVPMWQLLVMNGIFAGDANAKTVLRFYKGEMNWQSVEPWARKVKAFMQAGDSMGAACNKANG